MEVQVNVRQANGSKIDGEYQGKNWLHFTDGINKWYPFRIPYNANTDPTYNDIPMTYDLMEYAEGVGMTGWDWMNRQSLWVAYDFDGLIGHASRHSRKLTDEQLLEITQKVQEISWITVRKSTSGKGLHLYVFLNPTISTANHTEHSALARSILSYLSSLCNYDFSSRVDAHGGNMWVWHRKMEGTDGLTIIKKNTDYLSSIPPDWREHVPVILGKKTRTVLIPESENQDSFEELCGLRSKVNLDLNHQKLIQWLQDNGHYVSWNSERWLLITHTYSLKLAHSSLGLKGPFETISPGTNLNVPNCFLFPNKGGWWTAKRYTPGIEETNNWFLDSSCWRTCYYNREPSLPVAAKIHGGMENDKGSFIFNEASAAIKAVKELGVNVELPPKMLDRKTLVKSNSTNKLVIEIDHEPKDKLEGWIFDRKKWQKVFPIRFDDNFDENVVTFDDVVRHIVSEDKDLGWTHKVNQDWLIEPLANILLALQGHYQHNLKITRQILGSNVVKPWVIVNRPFQPEYTGGREWNWKAAQLRYTPSLPSDNLLFSNWSKILNNCGRNLDQALSVSDWGKKNGILTGADYLKCWIASLFQYPYSPLPYLFFYGPEDCGKSIFHEAIGRLMTRGYVNAGNALVSPYGFNGELEGAVLAVVEEIDLTKKIASNRIKDWVTSPNISIHSKYKTPYMCPNTTHWCVTSDCWIFTTDGPRQVRDVIEKSCLLNLYGSDYLTKGFFYTDIKDTYKLETIEGYSVVATEDHQILTLKGKWIPLGELKENDKIYLNKSLWVSWEGLGTYEEGLKTNTMTEQLERNSSEFYRGFLSNLFDRNSTLNKKFKRISIKGNNIIQIQRMLLRLGITSYLQNDNLVVDSIDNLITFSKRIGYTDSYRNNYLSEMIEKCSKKTKYEATVSKILYQNKEAVYDVTVPVVNCFDGNGLILHNCQTSNTVDSLPIFPGDTRITLIRLESLDPKNKIPKDDFLKMLDKEAPDFLRSILDLELPAPVSRLNIPVITTEEKKNIEKSNRSPVVAFLEENYYYFPGKLVHYGQLYDHFRSQLEPNEVGNWNKVKFGKSLPRQFPKGKPTGSVDYMIGNISNVKPTEEELKNEKYVEFSDKLFLESDVKR